MNYKITKKQFSTFVLLSVLLYAVAGYGLYWLDGYYASNAGNVATLRLQQKNLLQRVAGAKQVAGQESEINSAEALTTSFLPAGKKQSELIAEIEGIALEANVFVIKGINFESTGTEPSALTQTQASSIVSGLLEFPLEVTGAVAKYETLLVFLEKFETNRRKFQISDITITPRAGENGNLSNPDSYDVNISGRVFIQAGGAQ